MKDELQEFERLAEEVTGKKAGAFVSNISMSGAPNLEGEISDMERLDRLAAEGEQRPPDDSENRYGMSPLFDIHVAKKNSNTNYGAFGRLNFLPRLALIPFFTTTFDIPAEQTGGVIIGESIDDVLSQTQSEFDVSAANAAIQGGFNKVRTTAKQLAERFMNDHQKDGAGLLEPFQNMTYAAAKKLYHLVLPFDDYEYFIKTFGAERCKPRIVLGYQIKDNPFLDVCIDYLNVQAIERIEQAAISYEDREKCEQVRDLLLAYFEIAQIAAIQKLQEKEQEIAENKTRGGYDKPNRLVVDAPKPPDLVRLAHLNRVPVMERSTNDIMQMGKTIAENMAGTPAPNVAPGTMPIDHIVEQAKQALMNDPAFMAQVEASVLERAGLT